MCFFCVPQDLVAFSEKHDIQLLTHADPKGTCMNVNEQKLVYNKCLVYKAFNNSRTVGISNCSF